MKANTRTKHNTKKQNKQHNSTNRNTETRRKQNTKGTNACEHKKQET